MGTVAPGDVVIMLSNSGKTVELVDAATRLLRKTAKAAPGQRPVAVFSVTGDAASPLAALPGVTHILAPATPDLLGAVPTRSLVVQEAVGNAIVAGVIAACRMDTAAFKVNHPGGAIGAVPPRPLA